VDIVDIMAGQSWKEYNDYIKKKEIIMKDMTNIEAINELDEKRKETINEIYSHVNKNLDSIYWTLLPGTKAEQSKANTSWTVWYSKSLLTILIILEEESL
jgi:hypothetical protein